MEDITIDTLLVVCHHATMVKFDEVAHKYFWLPTGEEFMSVTKTLGMYKVPFDLEGNASRVARKRKISKEDVIAEWAKTNTDSCDFGHKLHGDLENWTKGGHDWLASENRHIVEAFQRVSPFLSEGSVVYAEKLLWNEKYKIAGTSDIIEEEADAFHVYDFKSNKNFSFTGFRNQNMLSPVDHLPDSKYSLYALQLSIYAFLYSKMSGKKVGRLGLFHLNRESGEWIHMPVPYLKYEVLMLLSDFAKKRGFVPGID